MEGSQPPNGAGRATRAGFAIRSSVPSDQMSLDQCRYERRHIVPKREPGLAKKLGDVIAGEIVPRLMLRHQQTASWEAGVRAAPVVNMSTKVADFADLVMRHDTDVADAYVKYLLHRGLDLETLLLHLLAPAARRLGQLWEADEIDFADVTIAISRLQMLLHRLTFELRDIGHVRDRDLLLVPAPGEQHTFGLVMASELFRREGWTVHRRAPVEANEFFSLISQRWFTIIGFSLSCDRLIEPLCSFIQAVRRASKNKSVQIMVGGSVFARDPALLPSIGADLVASDAREALVLAENAFKKSACR